MIKVAFNCTTNWIGGAIQNAANFIRFAVQDKSINYRFFVSDEVYLLLQNWKINSHSIVRAPHPLKDKKKITKNLIEEFNPDIIYTMAGPAYMRYGAPHILGISDAYTTHAHWSDFSYNRTLTGAIKHFLKCRLKLYRTLYEANYFIFQTNASRDGFQRRTKKNSSNLTVISNALGSSFNINKESEFEWTSDKELNILCPFENYPHKDLDIIFRISKIAKDKRLNKKIIIRITCKETEDLSRKIREANAINPKNLEIKNIGNYSNSIAQNLHLNSDIIFIPSVLETFSSSYIEAISLNRFCLIADKTFSREICKDKAIYFEEKNEADAAKKIESILNKEYENPENGLNFVLENYGGFEKRYLQLRDFIINVYSKEKK